MLVDLVHPKSSIEELDRDERKSANTLILLRIFLTALAIFAAWGVHALLEVWNLRLFDFVYLVIIPQLAIFGPVAMALAGRHTGRVSMAYVIGGSFLAGLGATIAGQHGVPYAGDGAGTLTAGLSFIAAYLASQPARKSA